MKESQLRQIIKEEISRIIEAGIALPTTAQPTSKQASASKTSEVKKIVDFLTGTGKGALASINNDTELQLILNTIWSGMNPVMQKSGKALAIKKIIDNKLS
jgi:hypothetical protein